MAEKQSRSRAFILGLGVVTVLSVLLWQTRGPAPKLMWLKQKITQIHPLSDQQKAVSADASLPVGPPAATLPPVKDEVMILNDRGVDLVLQKQYWPGIFLFKQAMDLDHARIEPVMNMAVTLGEIGLSRPAARYLAMVEAMDPDYSPLRVNRQNRKERMSGVGLQQSQELPHDQKR